MCIHYQTPLFLLHNIPHVKKKQYLEDLNRRLPTLVSESYEDEEADLVYDPARDHIEFLPYFYKDSQHPSKDEVYKDCQKCEGCSSKRVGYSTKLYV